MDDVRSPVAIDFAEKAAAIRRLEKKAVRDVIKIGAILTEVRGAMPHGQWLPWLEDEFAWAPRTPQRFMGVHALVSKNDTLSHLGLDGQGGIGLDMRTFK